MSRYDSQCFVSMQLLYFALDLMVGMVCATVNVSLKVTDLVYRMNWGLSSAIDWYSNLAVAPKLIHWLKKLPQCLAFSERFTWCATITYTKNCRKSHDIQLHLGFIMIKSRLLRCGRQNARLRWKNKVNEESLVRKCMLRERILISWVLKSSRVPAPPPKRGGRPNAQANTRDYLVTRV